LNLLSGLGNGPTIAQASNDGSERQIFDPRRMNMRPLISAFLILVLAASAVDTKAAVLEPLLPQSTETSPEARIKQRVIEIGPGSLVEVRLHSKEKLLGRVTAIADDSFGLQAVKAGKIAEQKVAFSDVKSIKQKNARAMRVWAIVGITLAAILVLGAIVAATGANN
jgi:Rieske Fe-S protein